MSGGSGLAQTTTNDVVVTNLTKQFGKGSEATAAVGGVSFQIPAGSFFSLLGPSGSGKTTLLRCIAGLESPTTGSIRVGTDTFVDVASNVERPVNKRDIGMVFQSYAIWPHMTVFENVAFPLRVKGYSKSDLQERTTRALDMVGLGGFHGRSATLLSGGQQQRVALARAIVKEAKLLLLDEPLSNLDAELRTSMRRELRDLQQNIGVTTIYVTHDQDEALSMSSRIALMRTGRVVEVDTPENLYLRPRDPFTARFIGQVDLVPGRLVQRDGERVIVETSFGAPLKATLRDAGFSGTAEVALLIRPEHIDIRPTNEVSGESGTEDNRLRGTITSAQFSGKLQEYVVEVNGTPLRVQSLSRRIHEVGDDVELTIPGSRCVVVPLVDRADSLTDLADTFKMS